MKLLLFSCCLIFSFSGFSQIESGKKKTPEKVSKKKTPLDSLSESTLIYASMSYGSSYRILKKNGDFYGKEPGEKANETALPCGNFSLGVKSKLQKNILLDIGFSLVNYGEKYKNTVLDSTTEYKNSYTKFAIPIKFVYSSGKKISFFAATGFQAQMIQKYSHKLTTTVATSSVSVSEKSTKGQNLFTLASCTETGVQFNFFPQIRFFVSGEFLFQLNNTFLKQEPYVHKPYWYGGKIGLAFAL